jgi:CRP-like cAMP-binding protein
VGKNKVVNIDPAVRKKLADIAVLRDCADEELSLIDHSCTGVRIMPGRTLCTEGELGRECFVIVDGEAIVTIAGEEIARLGAGSVCGEMAILDGRPRIASVTAATPMDVLVFTSGEFQASLREAPTFARNVTLTLASRLRLTDRSLVAARQDVALAALLAGG